MIISNLNHFTVVKQAPEIQGGLFFGYAFSDAEADASAVGIFKAKTITDTYTAAASSLFTKIAFASSDSSSMAI